LGKALVGDDGKAGAVYRVNAQVQAKVYPSSPVYAPDVYPFSLSFGFVDDGHGFFVFELVVSAYEKRV
jgi:hypothetical protein